jgi:tungstate transport system substrate-binding protein
MMRSRLLGLLLVVLTACTPPSAGPTPDPIPSGNRDVVLATTTSTQDSGLLDTLIPRFEQQTGYRVKTVAVGTGAALALGARGEADVVLVHAPTAEQQWMAEGNGTERLLVMHNDFVIGGPPADPAAIRRASSAVGALQRIAETQAAWVSRDDNSGTDQLEKQLWQQAMLDPRDAPWFIASGQGMGATLTLADQKNAYTVSDRATYLARRSALEAVILVEGDPQLLNIYHVMPVNPAKFPGLPINTPGGKAFADFMVSPGTQQLIGDFGIAQYGQPLFFPDAGKTEEQLRL